jgi:hypothetical protein
MSREEKIIDLVRRGTYGTDALTSAELAFRLGVRNSYYLRTVLFNLVAQGYLEVNVSIIKGKHGYLWTAAPTYPQILPMFR